MVLKMTTVLKEPEAPSYLWTTTESYTVDRFVVSKTHRAIAASSRVLSFPAHDLRMSG